MDEEYDSERIGGISGEIESEDPVYVAPDGERYLINGASVWSDPEQFENPVNRFMSQEEWDRIRNDPDLMITMPDGRIAYNEDLMLDLAKAIPSSGINNQSSADAFQSLMWLGSLVAGGAAMGTLSGATAGSVFPMGADIGLGAGALETVGATGATTGLGGTELWQGWGPGEGTVFPASETTGLQPWDGWGPGEGTVLNDGVTNTRSAWDNFNTVRKVVNPLIKALGGGDPDKIAQGYTGGTGGTGGTGATPGRQEDHAALSNRYLSTGQAERDNDKSYVEIIRQLADQVGKKGYKLGGGVRVVPGPEDRLYAKHDVRSFAVGGEGTGQSDDIPTMLSDGEYVFDADTVAALGDGSSKAGAEVLDSFREEVRKHKRSAPADTIPPKAKSPLEYLKAAKKGKRNG